jgi:hypothetical protein
MESSTLHLDMNIHLTKSDQVSQVRICRLPPRPFTIEFHQAFKYDQLHVIP